MAYQAVKTSGGDRYVRIWKLMDDAAKFGSMIHNVPGKFVTIQVDSRYLSRVLETRMFVVNGDVNETIDEALKWARGVREAEVRPTEEWLKRQLEQLKADRFQEEMSDDFFYTNGKAARYDSYRRELLTALDKVNEPT